MATGVSHAQGCLQGDAYYADGERVAVIAFDRSHETSPGVTNSFTMLLGETAMDGVVIWSDGVERPQTILMHDCPLGDVTGAELDACTWWQGIVYTVDAAGEVGLIPHSDAEAAEQLLLPGLAWQLSFTEAHRSGELAELPWDVFELTGCAQ